MKIIAFYLPQFHEIPENNEWWGNGFTEWVNMKAAKPLFEGHYQPRIPLDNNYYDLSNKSIMEWQINVAKEYGIYGFCFYHYWFDGHLLLEKPVELYLKESDLNFPFCICWANESWTKAWASKQNSVLIEQNYGTEKEWEEHFRYLLPFLKDERYIKVDNKPLIVIYRPELMSCIQDMINFWKHLAEKEGLPGLSFAFQQIQYEIETKGKKNLFDYNIEYQPSYAFYEYQSKVIKNLKLVKRKIFKYINKLGINTNIQIQQNLIIYNYDKLWQCILKRKPIDHTCIPCAFTDWDNTPRRGNKGSVIKGATPEKFLKYLKQQIIRAKDLYKKDIMFIFAWNEWAEGGYLEPDEKHKLAYLEAVKKALIETDEFPYE